MKSTAYRKVDVRCRRGKDLLSKPENGKGREGDKTKGKAGKESWERERGWKEGTNGRGREKRRTEVGITNGPLVLFLF